MVAIDIFDKKKYEDICPSTHNMQVPNVTRKEYQLLDVEDGFLSLMDDGGDVRSDIKADDDLLKEIEALGDGAMVTVLSAMGRDKAISCKLDTK